MTIGSRWYDHNPRISFAVNCLEKADNSLRKELVRLLIKKAMDFNIRIQRPKKSFLNRWYDTESDLRIAMEYLKNSSDSQRLFIAEYILTYVNKNVPHLEELVSKQNESTNFQKKSDINN